MIWVLLVLLVTTTYMNYKMADSDLFHPSIIVSAMFSIFAFFCCLANIYIGIDIENMVTIIVIMLGIGIFTIVNYFTHNHNIELMSKNSYQMHITVPIFLRIIGIICTCMAIYVNYHYIIDFAAAYGGGGDFFEAIVQYKLIMTFHDADDIVIASPWYRGLLITISCCFAYFAIFVFMKEKIINNKFDLICGMNVFLYILLSFMGGGRSEVFRVITAAMFLWYIFYKAKKGISFKVKPVLIKLLLIMSIIMFVFISFIFIIGRTKADMDLEYIITAIFIYAGAPIFNLDIYLANPWQQTHGIFGELTFYRLINWIGSKLGDSSLVYELYLPFLSYQNYNLGNVYTTFYAFVYDFGIAGVVVLTAIMAVACIWLYNRIKSVWIMDANISFCMICYAFLVNDLVMLPFSNRFYETVFTVGTIYKLVILYVLVYIVNKNISYKVKKPSD